MSSSAAPFFFNVYHVHSSLVASRAVHDEMLEFSARNNIKPILQVFKHKGVDTINEIFDSINKNKVRYRAVLEY
jgi:D-arabinose 1-dehydrogenase-like Zn-dependent alcohol dehydrogenase